MGIRKPGRRSRRPCPGPPRTCSSTRMPLARPAPSPCWRTSTTKRAAGSPHREAGSTRTTYWPGSGASAQTTFSRRRPSIRATGVRVVIEDTASSPGLRILRLARRGRLVGVDVAGPDLDPLWVHHVQVEVGVRIPAERHHQGPADRDAGSSTRISSRLAGPKRPPPFTARTMRMTLPDGSVAANDSRTANVSSPGRQHVGGARRQHPVAPVSLEAQRHRGCVPGHRPGQRLVVLTGPDGRPRVAHAVHRRSVGSPSASRPVSTALPPPSSTRVNPESGEAPWQPTAAPSNTTAAIRPTIRTPAVRAR